MYKNLLILLGIAAALTIAATAGRQLIKKQFELSKSETTIEPITMETPKKEVMVTNGIKHIVPLDQIIGGGPPKDGIPSIDNPKFISIKEAEKTLDDDEIGVSVSLNGIDRFYPFQILVWHEIVNDTFDGQRVLISYCPLCRSAIVFDPTIDGEGVEFGVSGKLWKNNLVMYDRKTETLWSQITGEALVGEKVPSKLKILPSDVVKFGLWKEKHPDGEVLSRDTGVVRLYGTDPYGERYYNQPGTLFPIGNPDDRLEQKEIILGIVVNGKPKAYHIPAIKKAGEVEDEFAGKKFFIKYENDLDVVRIFEKKSDGTLERINPVYSFWFSWADVYPETDLYK